MKNGDGPDIGMPLIDNHHKMATQKVITIEDFLLFKLIVVQ
jgi:hypothetical protein